MNLKDLKKRSIAALPNGEEIDNGHTPTELGLAKIAFRLAANPETVLKLIAFVEMYDQRHKVELNDPTSEELDAAHDAEDKARKELGKL